MLGVPFSVRPMKADGNAFELLDLVGRKQSLAGALVDGAGGEIAELAPANCAGPGIRPSDGSRRSASAEARPAFVELVVADGGDLQPHVGEGFDGGLIVEQRRQQRARADQVAGRHEYAVLLVRAQLLDQRRHVLGPAGGDGDLFGLVVGSAMVMPPGGGRRLP